MVEFRVIKTIYFRGRGDQRIRKVIVMDLEATEEYEKGVGFIVTATGLPPVLYVIAETIRDATLRTIEPRIRSVGTFGLALEPDFCFLDIGGFDVTTKALRIQVYGVAFGGAPGIVEAPSNSDITPNDIAFEIEYTSNSGAEG